MVRCETLINAKEYIKLLGKELLPSVQKLEVSHNIIFQQNNATVHTAKVTKKWLAHNSIDVMFWPGLSPDLNPIKNIWAIISCECDSAGKTFTSKEKLWEAVKNETNNISSSQCLNLVDSMLKRIDLLKKFNGKLIPYKCIKVNVLFYL